LQGDEVAAVLPVGALDGLAGLQPGALELLPQAHELVLELHHGLDTGQVEAGAGEVVDAAQALDVAVAVAAAAAAGTGGVEQPPAFVDAEGLGVDARQLGGHRDGVHAALVCSRGHLRLPNAVWAIPSMLLPTPRPPLSVPP